jgi:hypothetical protein
MTIGQFTAKWFTAYYFALGLLLLCSGFAFVIKTKACTKYLHSEIKTDDPPALLRTVLKYFFIFTIPGLIFSFFPFFWYELLFALWSLLIIFVIGSQLVHWPQTRCLLENYSKKIPLFTRLTGVMMFVISLVIILLGYQELQRLFPVQ